MDGDWVDILLTFCPKLFRLSLEALMKTQSDDVRLNCIGLSQDFNHIFLYFLQFHLQQVVILLCDL